MTCSTVNAATATTAIVTSAILLTSEAGPGAWLVGLAARANQTPPCIATNPAYRLICATSAATGVVKEGGDQGLPVTALMTGRP
jgi:hypothetical protein